MGTKSNDTTTKTDDKTGVDTKNTGGSATDLAGNENLAATGLVGGTPSLGSQAPTDLAGTNSNLAPVAPGTQPGMQPAVNKVYPGGVVPQAGTVDTSERAMEKAAAGGENVDEDRVKIGDTFKVVNLLKGADLVNPYAAQDQPREFPFNTPVEAKVDGFLHGQYLARRVRLEK